MFLTNKLPEGLNNMAKGTLIITDGEGNIIPLTPPPKSPPPTPMQIRWMREKKEKERQELIDAKIDRLIVRAKGCLCLEGREDTISRFVKEGIPAPIAYNAVMAGEILLSKETEDFEI